MEDLIKIGHFYASLFLPLNKVTIILFFLIIVFSLAIESLHLVISDFFPQNYDINSQSHVIKSELQDINL